jgi:tryptophan 2,3-dioxygenase
MHKNQGPVYYSEYLKLSELLKTQMPLSKKFADENNGECHDETLFIIVHQVYELWFKQILHELNDVIHIFTPDFIPENKLSIVVQRLERIKKIQGLLVNQLDVMESMTPMDFLEFRDLLIPASGFQSVQFREIEIKMGLNTNDRINVDREFFLGRLNEEDRKKLTALESSPSILKFLEKWLERLPYTEEKDFNFWNKYQESIEHILKSDEEIILKNSATLSEREKNIQLDNLTLTRSTFKSLFNKTLHEELISKKERKLSQKAILNALFILLYRDESMLTLPHQILTSLMDIDENFTTWRYRHALMAQRMLGTKIGTGGSSGHQYLKRAADNNRAFIDLFNLSTFLIPRSRLPEIPLNIKKKLNFYV